LAIIWRYTNFSIIVFDILLAFYLLQQFTLTLVPILSLLKYKKTGDQKDIEFKEIFNNDELLILFAQFLTLEYSYESLYFVQKVIEIEKMNEYDARFIEKTEFIINKFILPNSEMEVNLTSDIRKTASQQFNENDHNISGIVAAKEHVLLTLEDDNFIRFLHSKVMKRYNLTKETLRDNAVNITNGNAQNIKQ